MKRCFVISPIGAEGSPVRKHADDVFDVYIKPALDKCGIEALRSDHLNEPGKISEQMFRRILEDDLCIAVLTGHNPNVFYELAIAQSAARPVIILIEKGQDLPFDVQDVRCIYYDFEPKSVKENVYEKKIIEHVKSLEEANWTVSSLLRGFNPFTGRKFSLIIAPPEDKLRNLDITKINWDSEQCFLVCPPLREKISLVNARVGPTFRVEIGQRILDRVIDQPVRLELRDRKGNAWEVKSFYLFENPVHLSSNDPDKIERDYGGEEY
jgi:hypothetical protein